MQQTTVQYGAMLYFKFVSLATSLIVVIHAGESIIVSWTVENTGSGVTATDRWMDQVYWSSDEQFGKQVCLYITHSCHYQLLPALPHCMSVPFSAVGNVCILSAMLALSMLANV